MRAPRRAPAAALVLTVATWTASAGANECVPAGGFSTCVDVDNLWPRPGGSPFFTVGPARTTPPGEVAFGVVASYASRPLRVEAASPDLEGRDVQVVDNLFDVTFLLALGVTDRLEVTVAAPATFYQDGAGYAAVLGGEGELPRSLVRDPRFGVALAFFERERRADADGFALVGRFEIGAPLGENLAFGGARTATYVPAVTGDFRYEFFTASAEVGGRIRGEEQLGDVWWGSQLATSLGASFEIWVPLGFSMGAEAQSLVTLAPREEGAPLLVPAEWLASARMAPVLAGDLAFGVGGGGPIPLTDSAATAPRFRFLASVQYAPQGLDTDGDGVRDRDDACELRPEDRDAFEDADGCPDPDNDDDGIPDVRDRCRDDAETMDGHEDDDGCPDADDDGDGVPDEEDACRNDREDKDGFQDDDGCPEPDNDGDSLLDGADRCPAGPEDKDGFKDEDGCPDPDDDADRIADESDRCPREREDEDGFQDEDGCPDPDNDGDGVLDASDKCLTVPETLDGRADDDGCPEPGAKSIASVDASGRVQIERLARFAPGSAIVTPELERQLALVARLLGARGPGVTVIVEAYGDKAGDKSAAAARLGAARASAVRAVLEKNGIAADRVTAASGDPDAPRTAASPQIEIGVQAAAAPPP